MSHDLSIIQNSLALSMCILSSVVVFALYSRRKKTGMKALNLLIYIFLSMAVLGFIEFTQNLFHEYIPFYWADEASVPLIFSPVRLANLVTILMLFLFAENILERKFNIIRFSTLVVLISGIFFVGIISNSLDQLITTNMVIPFANDTRLDEFLFDILQLFVSCFVGYMFFKQWRFTESPKYRRYISLLLAATILYLGSMFFEVAEHLMDIGDINAFVSAFPTILLLAYTYLRHPNMIYLVPTDVKFLQIVSAKSGVPVYVAEFNEEMESMDYLVGPGLSSIRTMLRELLQVSSEKSGPFSMKSFEYNDGYLIFEESTDLFALLQADKLSRILLTSLAYFITEFEKLYGDQIDGYKGNIEPVNGETPDDLLRRCVPIVQAKPIMSSLAHNDE